MLFGKTYDVIFYLNDGEYEETIAQDVSFNDILSTIALDILNRYPEWNWHDGVNGWADVCLHHDGGTYIRVNGIGDVWEGQTYYIVKEHGKELKMCDEF